MDFEFLKKFIKQANDGGLKTKDYPDEHKMLIKRGLVTPTTSDRTKEIVPIYII